MRLTQIWLWISLSESTETTVSFSPMRETGQPLSNPLYNITQIYSPRSTDCGWMKWMNYELWIEMRNTNITRERGVEVVEKVIFQKPWFILRHWDIHILILVFLKFNDWIAGIRLKVELLQMQCEIGLSIMHDDIKLANTLVSIQLIFQECYP